MQPATLERLAGGAAALGVSLERTTLSRLAAYADLLLDWNRRINLTGARDEQTLVDRHLLDGLALLRALALGPGSVVDVGSGGGLPGLVLALARPELAVTLVESIKKKAAFLAVATRELRAPVEVIADRSETLRGRTFDHAIARAVYPPAEWLRRGAPLVHPSGRLLVLTAREPAPPAPGSVFSPVRTFAYTLPAGEPRLIHVYQRLG